MRGEKKRRNRGEAGGKERGVLWTGTVGVSTSAREGEGEGIGQQRREAVVFGGRRRRKKRENQSREEEEEDVYKRQPYACDLSRFPE